MNKKLWRRLVITHSILLLYIMIIFYITTQNISMDIDMFGKPVSLWVVLLIMYLLELLSTFTFQLRMKLTADYELTKNKKLIEGIPLIAGVSWMIAGFQGIIFLTGGLYTTELISQDIDNLTLAFLKLVPVFIATYNGVYTTLIIKTKEK